jgi:hypothetical protein
MPPSHPKEAQVVGAGLAISEVPETGPAVSGNGNDGERDCFDTENSVRESLVLLTRLIRLLGRVGFRGQICCVQQPAESRCWIRRRLSTSS